MLLPTLAIPAALSVWVWWIVGGAVVLSVAKGLWLIGWRRRRNGRQPRCTRCHVPLLLLDEVADDAYLDAGQRQEEQLGSVDYRVFICPTCQASQVERRPRPSPASRCPECGYFTVRRESKTVIEANDHCGGEVQVTESCKHCDYSRVRTRRTRPRTRFVDVPAHSHPGPGGLWWGGGLSGGGYGGDFGGGPSGGDFGGGSSGGGGAGSGW